VERDYRRVEYKLRVACTVVVERGDDGADAGDEQRDRDDSGCSMWQSLVGHPQPHGLVSLHA